MGYKEALATMVNNSGLTLREIADRCRANNTPLDPSYISKLQTGKQGPPSEEISKAIAEACGGNAEALILEGFIEKAPEPIQNFVNGMLEYIKEITVSLIGFYTNPEGAKIVMDQLDQASMFELMDMVSITLNEFKNNKNKPFSLDDKFTPNFEFSPNVSVRIIDESMSPIIPKGANVNMIVTPEYKTGDIVAVRLEDGSSLIRSLILLEDTTILVPESKNFEVLTFPKGTVNIVCKVKSVTTEI
ncbi:MAG: helix-turn-helix domain-containing protein [Bacillota bacterium]|nr:helix-turn-helix domain-containing protein [Bacillota bacterium]